MSPNRSRGRPPGRLRLWWTRASGRHALVRRVDRVQAWLTAATVAAVVVATFVAAGVGWTVHHTRSADYTGQQPMWRVVSAIATEPATLPADSHRFVWTVPACWPAPGGRRCDTVSVDRPVTAGQPVPVRTDEQGRYQDVTDPADRALRDAVLSTLVMWGFLAATITATAAVCRRRLATTRAREVEAGLAALLTTRPDGGEHPTSF